MPPQDSNTDRIGHSDSGDTEAGMNLRNEFYVIGHGLANAGSAFVDSAKHAWKHKGSSALEVGISFAAGLGLGLFTRRASLVGIAARGLGAAAGLSFLYDGIKPWKEALDKADRASNQAELDAASRDFARQFGRFAFDTVLMTPGAMAGTYAGLKLRVGINEGTVRLPKIEGLERSTAGKGAVAETKGLPAEVVPEKATVTSGGTAVESSATVKASDTVVAAGAEAGVVAEAASPGRVVRYKFEQLDPASSVNPRFDFGVEVSDPRLLRGQPNLDHHGTGVTSSMPSAAEQALALPKDQLPKPGSVLATIRPDLDSVTAMAVLANRLEGRAVNEALVREIGRLDRGLPPTELSADPEMRDLINAMRRKVRYQDPIHKKVFFAKDVLDGSVNKEYLYRLADRQREIARDTHARLDRDLKPEMVIPDKVVFVKSDSRMAMGHGYRIAPVVILEQENSRFRRFSVGVQDGSNQEKYFGHAMRELQNLEPGWGGRTSIFGSPQDRNTELTAKQVIDVVKKYIDPPAYMERWWKTRDFLWDTRDYLKQTRPFSWFFKSNS